MAKPKGKSTAQVSSNDPALLHENSIVAKIQAHKASTPSRAKSSLDARIKSHKAGGKSAKRAHKEGLSADVAKHNEGARSAAAQHKASAEAAVRAHKGIETQQESTEQTEKEDTQLSLELLNDGIIKLQAEAEYLQDQIDSLEEDVEEYAPVDEEAPDLLGPQDEDPSAAGLNAFFFKAEVYSDTQVRILRPQVRLGQYLVPLVSGQPTDPWIWDGFDGGVLHDVPLDRLGTFNLCVQVSYELSNEIYFLRVQMIHEYQDVFDGLKRPEYGGTDNALQYDGADGDRYWREFVCQYTISYNEAEAKNVLSDVTQIWSGHYMAVNDRIV